MNRLGLIRKKRIEKSVKWVQNTVAAQRNDRHAIPEVHTGENGRVSVASGPKGSWNRNLRWDDRLRGKPQALTTKYMCVWDQ